MRLRSTLIAFPLLGALFVSATGCQSCNKKKPEEEVKKDPVAKRQPIAEVGKPKNLVIELVIRDLEGLAKKVTKGAGFEKLVGPSPFEKLVDSFPDESTRKAVRSIDPHGAIAAAVVYDMATLPTGQPHIVGALRLSDPDLAASSLALASKAGKFTTWSSKELGVTVYESKGGKPEIAVVQDVLIVGDTREVLEGAGKYVAYRASTGDREKHDFWISAPFSKYAGPIRDFASKVLEAEASKVAKTEPAVPATESSTPAASGSAVPKPGLPKPLPPKVVVVPKPIPASPREVAGAKARTELFALSRSLVAAIADLGDQEFTLDVNGEFLEGEYRLGAKGSVSAYLSKWPSGDAAGLLSLPKESSSGLYRVPSGLNTLSHSGIDLLGAELPPGDETELVPPLHQLLDSLGPEFATVQGVGGTGGLLEEMAVKISLSDPVACKTATLALEKVARKHKPTGSTTVTEAPVSKFGADGNTWTFSPSAFGSGTSDTLTWAIKDKYLYVHFAPGKPGKMFDVMLDPASKETIGSDPKIKSRLDTFPGKGVIAAAFASKLSLGSPLMMAFLMRGGMGMGGAGLPPTSSTLPPAWSWATASSDGMVSKGSLPIGFIGEMVKLVLSTMGGRRGVPAMPPGGGGMPEPEPE